MSKEEEAMDYINAKFETALPTAIIDVAAYSLGKPSSEQVEEVFKSYVISSAQEAKTEDIAWEEFWTDFEKKDVSGNKILWRRSVEHVTDRRFEYGDTVHCVRCRFSTCE